LPPPNLSDLAGNLFKSAPAKEAES
jgi:hypothetical protein